MSKRTRQTKDEKLGMDEEDIIYFSTSRCGVHKWYAIDIKSNSTAEVEELSNAGLPSYFACCCCILKSCIYIVGGQFNDEETGIHSPPTNEFRIFHTSTKKLEYGPPMFRGRCHPQVILVEGKLFVFGGYSPYVHEPWAECYDGEQWHKLPQPPLPAHISSCSQAIVYGGNIIFWNAHLFGLYNVAHPSWHFISMPYTYGNFACDSKNVAVLDNVIFWCYQHLFAFDLSMLKRKPLQRFNLNSTTDSSQKACSVVATGNKQLCIVWFEHKGDGVKVNVNWRKFQISDTQGLDNLGVFPMGHVGIATVDAVGHYQVAGVLKQSDDKYKHDLKQNDEKPQIPDPYNLLVKLSQTMCIENFNSSASIEKRLRTLTVSAEGKIYLVDGTSYLEESRTEAEIKLEVFLEQNGLQEYLEVFKKEEIDVTALKYFTEEDFKSLDIPLVSMNKLVHALLCLNQANQEKL